MKNRFVTVNEVDGALEKLSKRITTAISVDIIDSSEKQEALSEITSLKCQIRDLQRQNLCLEFLVEHPNFNLDKQLTIETSYIEKYFLENRSADALINRYGYNYMLDNYHPDFILKLCQILVETFLDRRYEIFTLWMSLISTCGIITKNITNNYGPVETDNGIF